MHVRKKDHMYKSFIEYRTTQVENKYKQYKNKLITILRKAEKAYYCNKLDEYKGYLKGISKILNKITQRKKKQNLCINEFVSANRAITDGKDIGNCFNDFLKRNIGPSLAKKIKTFQRTDYSQCLGNSIVNSMYINPMS